MKNYGSQKEETCKNEKVISINNYFTSSGNTRSNLKVLIVEASRMTHEPENEDPIHHQESKTNKAATCKTGWVL